MNKKKHAFTLTELLVSLFILGTIAVFAVPPLMSDIHTKVYLNMIKNMSVTLEQLAADQMLNKRVHNLSDTDFGTAAKLLSSRHFAIVNAGTGLLTSSYKNFSSTVVPIADIDKDAALLKNGVVIVYIPVADTEIAGTFMMDANGNDGPNVIGKDFFTFDITQKGKIIPNTTETSLADCAAGKPRSCYAYVINNGWKYPQQ